MLSCIVFVSVFFLTVVPLLSITTINIAAAAEEEEEMPCQRVDSIKAVVVAWLWCDCGVIVVENMLIPDARILVVL